MNVKIFKPYGPLVVYDKEDGELNFERFWSDHANLAQQQGCYVFAIRNRGIKPWYVGKTTRTFKDEIFVERNLAYFYYPVLRRIRKGTPVIFLVAATKQKGPSPKRVIDDLETFLIQQGLSANPKLMNARKISLPKFGIRGVIRGGMGKTGDNAKQFRRVMAID